jgi:hypothetical protein
MSVIPATQEVEEDFKFEGSPGKRYLETQKKKKI